MRIEIPVKGGTLVLVDNGKVSWEYKGVISRNYAKELVAETAEEFMPTVNGRPFREWFEELA
jgi:hypothetical protein